MTERQPYDDIIRQRLDDHESKIAADMFERMAQKRKEMSVDPDNIIKDKLTDYESKIPTFMFDSIIKERDTRLSDADSTLRHKLREYESTVATDMFERIVQTRKGRRPVIVWWKNRTIGILASSLLLFSLAGGYFLIQKNTNQSFINSYLANHSVQEQAELSEYSKTEGITQKKPSHVTENNITNSTSISTAIVPEFDNTQHIRKSEKNILKSQNSDASTSTSKRDINNSNNAVSETSKITSNFPNAPLIEKSPATLNSSSEPSLKESMKQTRPENQTLTPLAVTVGQGIMLNSFSHEKVQNVLPCPNPEYGCPTFHRKKSGSRTWYLDAYIAPEYVFRRLKPVSDEYTDYRNARDTTELPQYAYSTGVRTSVLFDKGLILRGGVVYAQTSEKFQKDSIGIGNIRYVIDRNPTTGQLDTVEIQITNGIFRKTRYNRYQSLDFTVQAGYEFELNDNTNIGINGGVNINYQAWHKGTVLGQDMQAQILEAGQSIYQSSIGSSIVGSVSIYQRLSYRWQLMIEPQFRYYLRPITKSDYVLRQNYINVGLHVGLRYRITR